MIDNPASVRMLERLGFQREGIRREYSLEDDGTYHGSGILRLLRHEYGLCLSNTASRFMQVAMHKGKGD